MRSTLINAVETCPRLSEYDRSRMGNVLRWLADHRVAITKKQHDNLTKLSKFLRELSPEYAREHFDMRVYHGFRGHALFALQIAPGYIGDEDSNNCKTVACAAGFGPMAGVPKGDEENWSDYVDRAFGDSYDVFTTVFDALWDRVHGHNTALAAAQRIDMLLGYVSIVEVVPSRCPGT